MPSFFPHQLGVARASATPAATDRLFFHTVIFFLIPTHILLLSLVFAVSSTASPSSLGSWGLVLKKESLIYLKQIFVEDHGAIVVLGRKEFAEIKKISKQVNLIFAL